MAPPPRVDPPEARAAEYSVGARVPGTQFNVLGVLGRGGHATVYDVENAIGKRLVLKVIHAHLAARGDFANRFEAEARTLVQLEHPNIVTVYDLGFTSDERARPFIVMERLNGKNGREILLEVGRLELRHALDIGIDVCTALAAAHSKKVVHQDIKPDNIFIHVGMDGRPITKLVDFGIVRVIDRPQEKGIFEGTILYAAPEQLRFEGVSAKTDLYAVGLLLFELLTGVRPFPDLDDAPTASSAVQMRLAHVAHPAPTLSQWMLVPGDLEKIIQQCLEASPDLRPESAAKIGDALRTIRRRIGNAPQGPQTRTEQTLLGAVADVKGGKVPPAGGPATATFVPAAPVGRFGQANNADARIAQGVLTSEFAQAGGTQRLGAPAPAPRGKFGDALAEERASDDRPSNTQTAAPPEVAAPAPAPAPIERGEAPMPVGTLDPTVPTAQESEPRAPKTSRARAIVGVVVGASAVLLCAALVLHGRGSPSDSSPARSNALAAPAASPLAPPALLAPATPEAPSASSPPPVGPMVAPAPTASARQPPPTMAPPPAIASAQPAKGNPSAARSKPAAKAHDAMSDWLEPEKPATSAAKKKSDTPSLESF